MQVPVRVRMEHITKRYGPVLSLDDVSLELHAGEVPGLVGDNGAGKSTPAWLVIAAPVTCKKFEARGIEG